MNWLTKILAPSLIVILAIVYFSYQKNDNEMTQDSAKFDRDWNESMQHFAKSPGEKKKYAARATMAQSDYSSARAEGAKHKQRVDNAGDNLNDALDDLKKENGGGK
ncbi:hypothetical protein F6V30_14365 [Oryzomonas sagensis]|uniref:Uncharacterized protein n=1 Tax=Oryzomonas sagensis TaxID=2603857 RepID=A0ABQ6TL74_9BACT|nr:hypothetical protein [Oryzomonas sagensis]KAB0669017.1 hypothetical protein F6V30_14365 [Oryzomonas sagensis]